MRVAFVSTWKVPCGIATYTEELIAGMGSIDGVAPLVLAMQPDQPGATAALTPSATPVEYCWNRQGLGNPDNVARVAARYTPDVVHVQHEDGLFNVNRLFVDTLRALRASTKAKLVVTFHTVHPYGGPIKTGLYDQVRGLVDAVVVHTVWQRVALALARGGAPIYQIAHGTRRASTGDAGKGYGFLGVAPGRPILLIFGFLSSGKNIVATVKAYAEARARRLLEAPQGSAALVLAICGDSKDDAFVSYTLPATILTSGYDADVVVQRKFFSVDDIPHVMAAATFGVLNTVSTWYSASGQVHLYAAHGVPLAVAARPIYHDAIAAGAVPFEVDLEEPGRPTLSMVNAIAALSNHSALRTSVAKGLSALATETSWANQAKRHVALYRKLLGEGKDA